MKKYLPLILIGVGILIFALVFILIKNSKKGETVDEEETAKEIPQDQWPAVSLTPSEDGHWLTFKVQQIKVKNAATMDYELIYSTTSGGQQGVPGTVKLAGDVERKLLLGSESSGKFRYDDGVETGKMTIRFRDSKGKLIGKLSTDFHLQSGDTELTSVDGKFKYTLDKSAKGVFFVTMFTFAEPNPSLYTFWKDGYGIFSSDNKPHSGNIQ